MIASRTLGPPPNALHSIPFPPRSQSALSSCRRPVLIALSLYLRSLPNFLLLCLLGTNTSYDCWFPVRFSLDARYLSSCLPLLSFGHFILSLSFFNTLVHHFDDWLRGSFSSSLPPSIWFKSCFIVSESYSPLSCPNWTVWGDMNPSYIIPVARVQFYLIPNKSIVPVGPVL